MSEAEREAYVAALERDRQLALELGLDRPYVTPDLVGRCPGSAGYGHGMSLTVVHLGCCARWDAARAVLTKETDNG